MFHFLEVNHLSDLDVKVYTTVPSTSCANKYLLSTLDSLSNLNSKTSTSCVFYGLSDLRFHFSFISLLSLHFSVTHLGL